jgi:hypothetical protein
MDKTLICHEITPRHDAIDCDLLRTFIRRKQLQPQTLTNDSPWKEQGSNMPGFDPFRLKERIAFNSIRSGVPRMGKKLLKYRVTPTEIQHLPPLQIGSFLNIIDRSTILREFKSQGGHKNEKEHILSLMVDYSSSTPKFELGRMYEHRRF